MRAAIFAGILALTGAPLVAASSPAAKSAPQTLPWHRQFPHPQTAIKDVEGSFPLHTRVKQASTLHVLREGLLALGNEDPHTNAAEREAIARRAEEYSVTANTLRMIAVGDSNVKKRLFASKSASYRRDPKTDMPGTKMVFNGIKRPDQLADVIAYLREATR